MSSLPSASVLHDFFESQAAARPGEIAVESGSERLTYGELERRANQLARFLRNAGTGRGDCVALLLPRSLDIYVVVLGILKSGAAYVPIDAEYPAERVAFILADCGSRVLVTNKEFRRKASAFGGSIILMDREQKALSSLPGGRLNPGEVSGTPKDLAYVIYTSGTTGKPKGVEIEHRSVCHLVAAEAQIFQVQPGDRVYQGFSIAFDASVEEIWLAFSAGATLVVGTQEMARAGPALSGMLSRAGITVLSCVPTLLSMMEEDIPPVRLLILGGELCPPELMQRWWRPGRRVVNTYGPTEATVVATYAELRPDKPVTIGRPMPGYSVYILDENLRLVEQGRAGELCIGGIGLARGYLGRPEWTKEKFILITHGESPPQRLYRTGDLARWTPDGEIEFLGRIDCQVKIRGFRVELGEIESALLECPEVKAAAVALREDVPGLQQLVGYVVSRDGVTPDAHRLREQLQARLPPYMVPAVFESLGQLPTLPSGKVDRKSLLPPLGQPQVARPDVVGPRSHLERQLAAVWEKLFAPTPVSVRDNFFLDLGGHSLLAARMVSELRSTPPWEQISMLDVYRYPTIEKLAAEFERRPGANEPRLQCPLSPSDQQKAEAGVSVPFLRHFLCGAAQMISLVFVLSFFALQWLAPYLAYTVLIEEQVEYNFLGAILGAFASLVVLYPIMLLIPIAVKWVVIGRYRPGSYPLWGSYFFRWWLVTTIEAAVPVAYLTGTPLLNIYLRLMGARVGRNVYLGSDSFATYDLLRIGDDSSINVDSNLLGYTIVDGCLKIGRIEIGKGCFVGTRASLREDTVMQDGSSLEDLSLLQCGRTIPAGETWLGSPAQSRAQTLSDSLGDPESAQPRSFRRFIFGFLHAVGLLVFPLLVVSALFPGIVVMNELNYLDPYYWYLLLAPLVALSFIVLLGLEIAALKWLLLGRVKPGHHRIDTFYYLRKWFVDQTMNLSLDVMGPLYASVYLTPWYKLLGAKLGLGAEISTASFISPDLLSIGSESFIADSVSLGAARVRNGVLTVGENRIGRRSFIGNSAMLPPGTIIGDSVLIGCLSAPPANPMDALREDTTWMGSPAIFLPERQKSAAFPQDTTFDPTAKLRVQRATIEFIRVILPSTGFIILLSLLFSSLLLLRNHFSLTQTLLFFPLLYLGCGLAAALFTILAKWVLVGRYRPGEHPLWSTFVWRNELLNALHEHLAEPFLVGSLTGTPFICWYFRLLGARIGRRVYMETTDLSEFDLTRIGDEAALNADCTMQTHLFEDRVMKMSTVDIAARCSVGAGSLVLYDTRMEQGSSLGDLSLLMKGEILPAGSRWEGVPAKRRTE